MMMMMMMMMMMEGRINFENTYLSLLFTLILPSKYIGIDRPGVSYLTFKESTWYADNLKISSKFTNRTVRPFVKIIQAASTGGVGMTPWPPWQQQPYPPLFHQCWLP